MTNNIVVEPHSHTAVMSAHYYTWAQAQGPQMAQEVGGVPAAELPLRRALESAYRDAARLATDGDRRVELVDKANAVRPRTLV